jgi:uncharacterized membrane protein YccF (DUF307 family)
LCFIVNFFERIILKGAVIMRTLGNIFWFVFCGGFIVGTVYALLGLLLCVTIIGIPIGKAMLQYSKLMYLPFGKAIVKETFVKGTENVHIIRKIGGFILNLLWLPIGSILFLLTLPQMVASAISIIGIPFAIVLARSSIFLFAPIGAKVITQEEYQAILTAHKIKSMNADGSSQTSVQPQRNFADIILIILGIVFSILLLIGIVALVLGGLGGGGGNARIFV